MLSNACASAILPWNQWISGLNVAKAAESGCSLGKNAPVANGQSSD
jgi:hypothetical protein